ncbi:MULTISPECIES: hypothetical protein [Agrobacterium]|uniref:hypothetical protein n=1 Tax=Agrobacterium tumefaciens TaxID=358 RepID=UPI0015739E60|nr:hypothetical protein [Agrobacterium tumefaciens]NSZ06324.1 hypothetical protein [Agrobacterium tumefaciens]
MNIKIIGAMMASAMLVTACGGPIVEALTVEQATRSAPGDGAFQRYFLPKGELDVTVAYNGDSGFQLEYAKTVVADLDHPPYYIRFLHDGLGKETATISVDPNTQLLTTVKSQGTQQFKELIEAGNAILKGMKDLRDTLTHALEKNCSGIKSLLKFDILTRDDIKPVEQPIAVKGGCKFNARLSVVDVDKYPSVVASQSIAQGQTSPGGVVYFRAPRTYELTLTLDVNGDANGPAKMTVSAPDTKTLGYLRFPRGVFASRSLSVTFSNGMVSSQEFSRDSELIGFLAIPAAGLATAALIKQF